MLTSTHLHVCAVHVDSSSYNYKIKLYVHLPETGMTTEARLVTHLATPAILQDHKSCDPARMINWQTGNCVRMTHLKIFIIISNWEIACKCHTQQRLQKMKFFMDKITCR